jgi:hypothetical protein
MLFVTNRSWLRNAAVVVSIAGAGCASHGVTPVGQPVPDAAALEASLRAATVPESPRQATFSWSFDEAGSTVRGRGVVRYVAPHRLRLDLFGARGETYLAAALDGDEFRLPPNAVGSIPLPSPSLLWSALGVLRPPTGADLDRAARDGPSIWLTYLLGNGQVVRFRVEEGPHPRVTRSELSEGGTIIETVEIAYGTDGNVQRAVYQDRKAYRELVLETEGLQEVAEFPESVWRPDVPLP